MTIEEAIRHCEEVAEQNETKALSVEGTIIDRLATKCRECAADHRQLAEWLTELKDLRAEQNDQYTFIRELMDELNDAKRLLKVAVEFRKSGYCTKNCSDCVASPCDYIDWFKNMYDNEIEKLIGGSENG